MPSLLPASSVANGRADFFPMGCQVAGELIRPCKCFYAAWFRTCVWFYAGVRAQLYLVLASLLQ